MKKGTKTIKIKKDQDEMTNIFITTLTRRFEVYVSTVDKQLNIIIFILGERMM